MATEIEKLEVLIRANVATRGDLIRYIELGGQVTAEQAKKAGFDLEELIAQAKVQAEAPPAPVVQAGAVDFEDEVDVEKFKEGGAQYYMPSEEGFWKSELVEVDRPSFAGDKDLKIFSFETNDPKLKSQGRGAIWVEMGKGAFSLKTILDGIGVPYTIEGSKVKYSISFPHPCYANWSMDPKGRASGNVLITGLRTLEAGAAIEKAV